MAVAGRDVLAKARTGTGKTLAFLIPVVERLIKLKPVPHAVGALVLSPTRELAMQIYEEGRLLTHFHKLRSEVVFGGTNIRTDQRNLSGPVDILVATPGRLTDHLENTNGFAARLEQLAILVLDEADQMLEMGFRPAITKILGFLPEPRDGRQTLLFSATIPKELVQIAPVILGASFEFVDAVASNNVAPTTMTAAPSHQSGAGARAGGSSAGAPATLQADNPFATAAMVTQDYYVTSLTDQMAAVYSLLEQERRMNPKTHKIIVFFTTARQTQLYAELFNALGIRTLEIHSRQSQGARQRASDEFRECSGVTMFSSDVTARGMDYPDVTYVLQVGLPSSTEQYIHRLGRTARAGKQGRGSLVLCDFETGFLRGLSQLPVKNVTASLPKIEPSLLDALYHGLAKLPYQTKAMAYAAWLGYYNSAKVSWSKPELVRQANYFATDCLFLPSPPELQRKTVGKMGLKGVPGLVLEAAPQQQQQQRQGNFAQAPQQQRGGGRR
jgi:ATP-dependent RNA helicase MSS116